MTNIQQIEAIRKVLRKMLEVADIPDVTQLAKRAGIAHTTLTRIMRDDPDSSPEWIISAATWMKLTQATGVPVTILGDKVTVAGRDPVNPGRDVERLRKIEVAARRVFKNAHAIGMDLRNLGEALG